MKQRVCQAEDAIRPWAENISRELFFHPEESDKEYASSRFLVEEMKRMGFTARCPYLGIETAFCCEYRRGGKASRKGQAPAQKEVQKVKRIAFLAEYDALPGYGKQHDKLAHACGHNWIAASTAAACAALSKAADERMELLWIGTPGEELSGRKADMAKAGVFDDLDAVFQMHLGQQNCVNPVTLAMTDFVFSFHGKAAHASKQPEQGINALDACQLTLAGINAWRQQLPPEVKLHAVYRNGGSSPGVIPDFASLHIYVRDESKDRLERIIDRLLKIGKGAEFMTGAHFTYARAANTYYDLKQDQRLSRYMKENLMQLGIDSFAEGDRYHAESSDIGNVSYCCPTCYCTMGVSHFTKAELHEEAFLQAAYGPESNRLLHIAAKAMAMSALDVLYEKRETK